MLPMTSFLTLMRIDPSLIISYTDTFEWIVFWVNGGGVLHLQFIHLFFVMGICFIFISLMSFAADMSRFRSYV